MCFNWLDQTATTSRYPEALSVGMIPFVWQNYDENNTYNIDSWQRITDYDMLKDKMMQLRNDALKLNYLNIEVTIKKCYYHKKNILNFFSIKMDVF